MDFELRKARKKLEKEQKERKEKARVKLEREKKAKEGATKQREAIEAVQRSRRIDAAEAQLKADEQMQESVLAGRGVMFYRLLEAVPYQGIGDEIKLPPSCFTELSDQGAFDKGPMYFQLSVVHQEDSSDMNVTDEENRRTTHSGVLEFTADEGSVSLPPHVWHNLFPAETPKTPLIEVRYVWLPKGTYAKLQPERVGFSDLPNHKAILETSLRQHATLSQIEAETDGGDIDLFISRHPLIFPTRHQHEWSSHYIGSKILILSSKDKNLGAGTYSVGVFGFKGTTKYKISVSVQDDYKRKVGQHSASTSSPMEMDSIECRNCKHYIPSRTIALHEAFCSRHNVVCQHAACGIVLRVEEAKNHVHCNKCGQAFQQGEMEKHMKVFHEPLQCPCGIVLEKEQMVQHQASVCPLRLVTCRFCGDVVPAGNSALDVWDRLRGLSEHESLCGSRTAPCDSCGRSVMLKDMDIHQVAVHQKS
nr:isoform 2 of traf-type zinc finger domain-containing protein 1 [Quercus suber]